MKFHGEIEEFLDWMASAASAAKRLEQIVKVLRRDTGGNFIDPEIELTDQLEIVLRWESEAITLIIESMAGDFCYQAFDRSGESLFSESLPFVASVPEWWVNLFFDYCVDNYATLDGK